MALTKISITPFFPIQILPIHPGGRYSYFTATRHSRAVLAFRVLSSTPFNSLNKFGGERIALVEWIIGQREAGSFHGEPKITMIARGEYRNKPIGEKWSPCLWVPSAKPKDHER
ncbi:MAG TPA: hypothetical protein VFS68_00470, partial [Candidatus Udaeobacter sp.]|nr:hypothetical protein [Candidatus Udaeobacter sp.]